MSARLQPEQTLLDESHVGKRVLLRSQFGEDDNEATTHWCVGTIEDVCNDGTSAWVLWDAIPEEDYPATTTLKYFSPRTFNDQEVGSWRFDLSEIIDGLEIE